MHLKALQRTSSANYTANDGNEEPAKQGVDEGWVARPNPGPTVSNPTLSLKPAVVANKQTLTTQGTQTEPPRLEPEFYQELIDDLSTTAMLDSDIRVIADALEQVPPELRLEIKNAINSLKTTSMRAELAELIQELAQSSSAREIKILADEAQKLAANFYGDKQKASAYQLAEIVRLRRSLNSAEGLRVLQAIQSSSIRPGEQLAVLKKLDSNINKFLYQLIANHNGDLDYLTYDIAQALLSIKESDRTTAIAVAQLFDFCTYRSAKNLFDTLPAWPVSTWLEGMNKILNILSSFDGLQLSRKQSLACDLFALLDPSAHDHWEDILTKAYQRSLLIDSNSNQVGQKFLQWVSILTKLQNSEDLSIADVAAKLVPLNQVTSSVELLRPLTPNQRDSLASLIRIFSGKKLDAIITALSTHAGVWTQRA